MQISPIQLEHYVLKNVSLECVEGATPVPVGQYADWTGATLSTEVTLGDLTLPDGGERHSLELALRGEPKKDGAFQFRFHITLTGVFAAHNVSDERRRELVAVNGTSILYSAAREILLSLSMRSAMGFMLLPTVHFQALAKNMKDVPADETSVGDAPAPRAP